MSAPDPHCATCGGAGDYPCGGLAIPCLCTARDCGTCTDDEPCDEHFAPSPVLPGSLESLPYWDRAAMARFSATPAGRP